MKRTARAHRERFRSGARQYADYLATPEGRLRSDLAFANLQTFMDLQGQSVWSVLDIGGGPGATALRLARLGHHVTLLDSSPEMLDLARHAARTAGVTDQVTLQLGNATHLANLFQPRSFDLILCHNVLEYCDNPGLVLSGAARALRDLSAALSILVRNQAGEVLKAAVQAGDLAAAENGLTAEWGQESLYGEKVRLFTPAGMRAMLAAASLEAIEERGVRVLADYLPAGVSRSAEYDRILELERKLGSRPDFAAVSRYTHCLARLVSREEDGA